MAQVLKEELRERIVDAAKKELLAKGVKDASMRSIAFNSGMTVGNLYRYFKGKDELIQFVVSPCLEKLNELIQHKTHDRISLFETASSLDLSKNEMKQILDSLADDLTVIYHDYKDEMKILFMDSEVQFQMSAWFTQLIVTLITEGYSDYASMKQEVQLFARMMAVSIFSGLQECFRRLDDVEFTVEETAVLVKLYLRLYLSMLDFDVTSFVQEVVL